MADKLELEELKKVAQAATPGPWQNGIDDLEGVVAPHQPGLGNVVCIPPTKRMYSSLEKWAENAEFIATFDPPTVLALIAEVAASRRPSPPDLSGEREGKEAEMTFAQARQWIAYYTRRGADDLGVGEVERLLNAAKILASLTPPEPEGEPVAWISPFDLGEMRVPASRSRAVQLWRIPETPVGTKLEPLFTRPAPGISGGRDEP